MVGLLALTANHYIQMDPQALQKLFRTAQASDSPDEAPTQTQSERFSLRFWELLRRAESPTPRPPEQVRQEILKRMKSVETYLLESNDKQDSVGERLPAGELAALVQLLNQLNARLQADAEASAEQHREARLSRLYGCFLAAQMVPSSFSDSFLEIAEQVIKCPDETEASHAAALKLLHQLDLRNPSPDKLLAEVQAFTQRYPVERGGDLPLFDCLERTLATRKPGAGRASTALGAQSYTGQRGVSQLLNQLIDQRHRP